jgi:leucyl aminopeptidase (aminopeptidase T)
MFIKDREIETIDGTKVTFKDGAVEEFTEKQLEYIVTDEAKDDTEYQNIVLEKVA